MIKIEDIVLEQLDKVIGEYEGGYKYGDDYNRVKSILEYHEEKVLVKSLAESIEDEELKSKVQSWMEAANA